MSCETASPGACFVGQLLAGSFFGFFFGVVSEMVVSSEWYGAVPGLTVGSCMGVMSARYPDGPPDAAIVFIILGGALCGTALSCYYFHQNIFMASISGTALVAAGMYVHTVYDTGTKIRKAEAEAEDFILTGVGDGDGDDDDGGDITAAVV